jgi:hypothetical protein
MPTLRNPRHERFAQLVASGIRPQNAYVSVGFSKKGAHQSAGRTLRIASVKARVEELQLAAADSSTAAVRFDHDRVLSRLDELSRVAQEKGQLSAAVRAEELIGRARGLFVERSENVQLDLNKQIEKRLEEIAFRDDPKRLEEWRRGEPAGQGS